jgi:hypothetical protein
MLQRWYPGIVVLVSLAAGAGCAQRVVHLYDGGARPRAQVATLWYMDGIYLRSVDDREEAIVHHCTRKDACLIELLPGRHTLRAAYYEVSAVRGDRGAPVVASFVSLPKTASFEVEAGKFYSITASRQTGMTDAERKNMVSTVFGGGAMHDVQDDDWTLKIEPSGDPDHPIEE